MMSDREAGQDLSVTETDHLADYTLNVWYVAGCRAEFKTGISKIIQLCGLYLDITCDANGNCQASLSDTGSKLPSVIQEGLVWVFVTQNLTDEQPPQMPPVFNGPKGIVRFCETVTIPASQDDAVYGLLDPAHTPFVHRSPIWRGNGVLKEKQKVFEPSHMGFTMKPHAPVNSDIYNIIGGQIDVEIAFQLPGLRAEYISNEKHCVLGLTALTPIDETHTSLRQIFYWDSPVLNLLRPIASLFAKPFLQQDVDIMKLRRDNLEFVDRKKGMLVGDSDRQYTWYKSIKREWQKSGYCPVSFNNPVESATLRWRT